MTRLALVLRALGITAAIASVAALIPTVILPLAGPPRAAAAFFASAPDTGRLPDGVSILSWQGGVAMLDGVDAAVARKLYSEGALLVVPVRRSGCMTLREK